MCDGGGIEGDPGIFKAKDKDDAGPWWTGDWRGIGTEAGKEATRKLWRDKGPAQNRGRKMEYPKTRRPSEQHAWALRRQTSRRRARGRGGTILTSPLGITEEANISKKTLLGQ